MSKLYNTLYVYYRGINWWNRFYVHPPNLDTHVFSNLLQCIFFISSIIVTYYIVFFDEVDAIGGARFDDGVGGDNEVQRTMLEIVNQLDGFDAGGNIKVPMATNR